MPSISGSIQEELTSYEIERNKPMPSLNHSAIQTNLATYLNYHFRKKYTILSEISLVMPEKPDAIPDLAIYPKIKIDYFEDQLAMEEMPLTAIEISSPSQSDSFIVKKINRYFKVGVKSCWFVMPSLQAISVYSEKGKYQFFSADMTLVDPVSGIEIPLSEVFAE